MNGKNSNYLDKEISDFCEICECVDPYPYCVYLPVMKIWVDDPGITMQEFEVIEDTIAKAIGELGYAGRIESYTTENTTTFPLVEQEE